MKIWHRSTITYHILFWWNYYTSSELPAGLRDSVGKRGFWSRWRRIKSSPHFTVFHAFVLPLSYIMMFFTVHLIWYISKSPWLLQWCHNEHDGVPNHKPLVCLLNCLYSKKTLALVKGIHRWPVDSPHKGPVTQKMIPFDDIMKIDDMSVSHSVTAVHYCIQCAHQTDRLLCW